MTIIEKILKGASWNIFGKLVSQVLSLGTMIILARLLSPQDFGLIAMSYVVRTLANVFVSLGMASAIIQRKTVDDGYLSTAFWASMCAGIIIALIMVCLSPLIAIFFQRSELVAIVCVTSIIFLIGGGSSTHRAILEKAMKFRELAFIDLYGQVAGSLAAIGAALAGMGYWSLVLQEIAANFIRFPLLWRVSHWKPKLVFNKKKFRDLFGFSSYVLFSNMINFFNRNGDNIIIGRFLGAFSLGLYDFAYSLMLKPLQYISATTSKALFPALSEIQGDKKAVCMTYIQMVRVISLITFPMMTGLSIVAPQLISIIYGSKWLPAIPVFQILCFVGLWQSIGTTVGTILLSQGRSDLAFKMTLVVSPFVWMAFYIGSYWGVVGVAWAYAIISGAWWIISHGIANKLINLSMNEFLKALLPATFGCIVMVISLKFMSMFYNLYSLGQIYILIANIIFGTIFYLGLLFIIRNPELKKILSPILERSF
jgi:PST family polysaccharide transporter